MNSTKRFVFIGQVRRDTLKFNGLQFAFFFSAHKYKSGSGSLGASPADERPLCINVPVPSY